MDFLIKIQAYLDNIDAKHFYRYCLGFIAALCLISSLIMFQYYRKVRSLKNKIETVNGMREEVRTILGKVQHVKKEQREVDELLKQDPNFKIAGYFEEVLSKTGLNRKKASLEVTSPAREGKYQESLLNVKLTDMTMKELTELLQEIEQNKRVFTKELEITASRKNANSIDVNLTIATLEPRIEGEIVE